MPTNEEIQRAIDIIGIITRAESRAGQINVDELRETLSLAIDALAALQARQLVGEDETTNAIEWFKKEILAYDNYEGGHRPTSGQLIASMHFKTALAALQDRQPVGEDADRALDWIRTGKFEIQVGDGMYVAESRFHPNTAKFRQTIETALRQMRPEPCDVCNPEVMEGNPIIYRHSDNYIGNGKFSAAGRIAKYCGECGRRLGV